MNNKVKEGILIAIIFVLVIVIVILISMIVIDANKDKTNNNSNETINSSDIINTQEENNEEDIEDSNLTSQEQTAKKYAEYFYDAKASKLYDITDMIGMDAFDKLSITYNSDTKEREYNFEKFEEYYKESERRYNEQDEDKKIEVENNRKDAIKQTQDYLYKMKDYLKDNNITWKIKDVKSYNVNDCKILTKVIVTIKLNKEDQTQEDPYTFYIMKKGLKNYVVHAELF